MMRVRCVENTGTHSGYTQSGVVQTDVRQNDAKLQTRCSDFLKQLAIRFFVSGWYLTYTCVCCVQFIPFELDPNPTVTTERIQKVMSDQYGGKPTLMLRFLPPSKVNANLFTGLHSRVVFLRQAHVDIGSTKTRCGVLVCGRLLPLLCKNCHISQLLNRKQITKLQKAAKIAKLLATDDVPFHKHPDFVSGSHPLLTL